jgi:hypothetical protein
MSKNNSAMLSVLANSLLGRPPRHPQQREDPTLITPLNQSTWIHLNLCTTQHIREKPVLV